MQLKIAELSDIDATLRLHAKFQIDGIAEEDKRDGFVTTAFTKEELTQLIEEEQGLFIAKYEGEVIAYVMVASWSFWSRWEMFQFMIENLHNLEYLGETLSVENSYQYGPVCLDKSVRGTGMLEALFDLAREQMAKRYPILVTFINKLNSRSYEAHHRKLGLTVIDEFSFAGNEYWEMVYDTSKALELNTLEDAEVYSGKPFIFLLDYPLEHLSYEDITDPFLLEHIYSDMKRNYYWSSDFSAEFYVAQAKAGFIAVSIDHDGQILLVPEIQKSYAVLDFKDLHISKKVKRLLKRENLALEISTHLDEVACAVKEYHGFTWLRQAYMQTLKEINLIDADCHMISVMVRHEGVAVAGEIGYIIGRTYTSLTGFSSKEKMFANYGTAQLVLLAQYLEKSGFAFMNLGQPYMPYKLKLGAKIYEREIFLKRWFDAVE